MSKIVLPNAGGKGSAFPNAKVNQEILAGLEVHLTGQSGFEYPGMSVPRSVLGTDARLLVAGASTDKIQLLEHIATVYDRKGDEIYIVARQTLDGLMREQQNPELYPKWLFDTPGKQAERAIYVNRLARPPQEGMQPSDYLEAVKDDMMYYTLVFFLIRAGLINQAEFKG